jgi:hypothetical protein
MRYATGRAAFAVLVLSAACLAPAVQAQSKDPVIGSWKINQAKSTYTPGPPPKALATRFEAAGKGLKNTTDFTNPEGKSFMIVYTAEVDGKDYPLAGSASATAVSLKKLPDGSVERTDKKDGKVVQTLVRQVSKDGKTLTVTQKGKTPQGAPVRNVMVFEKQ